MIKKSFCLLFLLAFVTAPCHARWGMTYEECLKFYGKPNKTWKTDDGVITRARFRRADDRRDITVTATFVNARCSSVTYCCSDNSFMTTETLYAILKAYANEEQGIQFVPLEMLAAFTEEDLVNQKGLLKRSIKEQIWFLAGRKGSATLYAVFNRDAQMLRVTEVKVKEVGKGETQKVEPKKPIGF